MTRRLPRTPVLAALLATLLAAPSALGQGAIAIQDDTVPAPEPGMQGMFFPQNNLQFLEQNFNQWAYGNAGGPVGTRRQMETALAARVGEVARGCGLSPSQRAKVELAGRGDIARFFDRVDDLHREFKAAGGDPNKVNEIATRAQAIQQSIPGDVFGDGSLLEKSLRTTLDAPQRSRRDAMIADRLAARHEARVALAAAIFGQNVGLTAAQRPRLAAVFRDETRPPRRPGQYDYYGLIYQASYLPESKLRPIFDDAQWRLARIKLDQSRANEAFLRGVDGFPENWSNPATEAAAK